VSLKSLVRLSRTSAGDADWSDSQTHRNRSGLRGTIIQEELLTRLDRFSREWRNTLSQSLDALADLLPLAMSSPPAGRFGLLICSLPSRPERLFRLSVGTSATVTIRDPIPLSTLSSSPLNSIGQNSGQTKAAVEGRSCPAIPGPAMPQIADPSKQPSPNRLDLQLRHPEGGSGRRPPGPGASSHPPRVCP
jgi:hypothetical protein